MMNKKKSSKKQLGMYFLIVPCIVASLFVFGISKAYQASEPLEILLEGQLEENDTVLNRDTIPNKKEYKRAQPLIRIVTTSTVLGNPLTRKVDTSTVLGDPLLRKIATGTELENLLIRKVTTSTELKNPLVIVDGIQQEKTFEQVMLNIPQEEIESVSVLKDEEAAAYSEKGKNGVILVTTKAGKKADLKEPLYVIDGIAQERSSGKLKIKSEDIESMSVMKDQLATAIYGDEGKHGVILVTTKAGKKADLKEPLYVIDGVAQERSSEKSKIKSEDIESMSVMKDQLAISIYGDEGKHGVILVTTKAGEKAKSERK